MSHEPGMLSRKIVHLELGGPLPPLAGDPRYEGLFVVFWAGGVPIAHREVLSRDLPMSASDVSALAREAASASPGDEVSPGRPDAGPEALRTAPAEAPSSGTGTQAATGRLHGPPPDASASVVICTRDRPERLAACLRSLRNLSPPPKEILVVDNAPSTDDTRRLVSGLPGIRYVVEPRAGLDVARNTGVRHTDGEFVAFADDDVLVHPEWLGRLLRGFRDPTVMAVTGLVLPAELDTEAQLVFETWWSFNRGYRPRVFDAAFFAATRRRGVPVWEIGAGASMAFRRRVFELVGGFDERLDVGAAGCNGDTEFWYRILAEGWRCRYEPAAVAYHHHRRDGGDLDRQIYSYMRGHVASLLVQFEKYGDPGNLWRLLVTLPAAYSRMLAGRVLRGPSLRRRTMWPEIRGCLSGVLFYLRNRRPGTARRRRRAGLPVASGAVASGPGTSGPGTSGPVASARVPQSPRPAPPQVAAVAPRSRTPPPARPQPAGRAVGAGAAGAKVSIVIPCHDQAHFLGEAIESALRQSCRDVEVIVVDDGSTDGTADVAARYPGVTYVRQDNLGLSAARNTGIRTSTGEFLVFLDADDRLLPDALRAGLTCFERHPEAALVSGNHRRISVDGAPLDAPGAPRVTGDHYLALLSGNYIGMHAAVMYRREVLEAAGGFDPALRACEDYDLYLRIARAHPIRQHPELVAEYRQHGANMSRDAVMMLRTVLAVLRSQSAHLGPDRRRRSAYRAGCAAWREYYGDELIRQLKRHLQAPGGYGQAGRCIAALLRYTPKRFAERALRQVARRGLGAAGRVLPVPVRRRLRARHGEPPDHPPPGRVDLGDLRRVTPVSRVFGFDRGLPIDRYYIEGFLARNADAVRGRVLEIGDDTYTRRFGGDRVSRSDVLHVAEGNPRATIVGDLATADHIPSGIFDCVILTQTLHLVYDMRAALATLRRVLRPGGVLLATVPGISQLEEGQWGETWYWSLTVRSARRLLEEVFPPSRVEVDAHGNVLAAVGFLHGLAAHELRPDELDYRDPHYQLLITMRATRPEAGP